MIVEGWRTPEDSQAVEFDFYPDAPEDSRPILVTVSRGWQTLSLTLTVEEFKGLLKAGLRFDEKLPRPSEWVATIPEVKTSVPKGTKEATMAKKQITTLVCDGCGADITEGEPGSAKARVEVVGEDFIRNIDFCPVCVSGKRTEEDGSVTELHGGLPMGTTRKKRSNGESSEPEVIAPADMTVAQLDEKYGELDGYPAKGKQAEKVAFAEALAS